MDDTPDMGGLAPAIPARSKRQAMDWSLVLASQDIAAIINRGESGWELIVDKPEHERAQGVLLQYQIENRGWGWRREVPGTGVIFHWGSVLLVEHGPVSADEERRDGGQPGGVAWAMVAVVHRRDFA